MDFEANPYLPIIHRNLPRLLALYNSDTTHPLCGCGDRRYWAWKLIDFPNGTFQGASFGLAKLLAAGMLPKGIDEEATRQRIEAMISVVPALVDAQGALGEALPNEGSFCVTGLVLGDCLGAISTLEGRLSNARRQELMHGLEPLASFLKRQDETHGIISNHLASTALAMVRWAKMTGDQEALPRAKLWIDRIRDHANAEGWMLEYGGADPGYQSWCSSALAQIAEAAPEIEVDDLLDNSFRFLEAFAMPDGSFANGCGSRMTRFLMSGGAELRAKKSEAAARLACFSRRHAGANHHVSLDSIDEPNIVPFFNDMVLAAVNAQNLHDDDLPPAETRNFPDAGLYVHRSEASTVTVNVKRGGWMTVTPDAGMTQVRPEPTAQTPDGVVLRPVRGAITKQTDDVMVIEADLEQVERMLPTPLKFIVLRLLSLTAFRSARLGNQVKRMLAKLLLSEKGKSSGRIERTIALAAGTVTDKIISGDARIIGAPRGFSPMHMASQGYWQVSDDTTPKS